VIARFSELKKMALSPLHYKYACENKTEATRSMSIGTIAHAIVLGERADKKLVVWEGVRRGKLWDEFATEHKDDDIVTSSEWTSGEQIAEAVVKHPEAARLLTGKREVPMQWEHAGMAFATRGVDVIGDGFITELKSTQSAEPSRFSRLSINMFYHCQMVLYRQGAAELKLVAPGADLFIVGVESKPPYPVSVLHITQPVIELAAKTLALWCERLRSCQENDYWPGYSEAVVEMGLPAWMSDDVEDDE